MDNKQVIEKAKEVLMIEAQAILDVRENIGDSFYEAIKIILESKGKLVISGIGKSGLIGNKIVATLNSTGTKALTLHPVEALHGDLGQVSENDIFIGLSNSGETEELVNLLPIIKHIGCKTIALTGNPESTLAKISDIVINVGVKREACSLGLAPTSSTTALLAVGDALAIVLEEEKHFEKSDFQRFHPGGKLGQRLACKIADIMLKDDDVPKVAPQTPIAEAITIITRGRKGAAIVVDAQNLLLGIITDGDLRRALGNNADFTNLAAQDIMTASPKSLSSDLPAAEALDLMESRQITVLPITDGDGHVAGILHLHDILGKGMFKFSVA